jgi:phosphoserine phosphatase
MSLPASHSTPGLVLRAGAPLPPLSYFKLAAFDMDSTLISIECIDEIAAMAGKGAEVAAITEAAMRGEITDFKDSLRRRLALLAGTPASVLERVLAERLTFNPGARELCAAMKAAGMKLVLVSGGFTFFTRYVAAELGMDFVRSNELEIADGVLTGHVALQDWGDICDGEQKRLMLVECCARIGCSTEQAMAIGDGANDLPMMGAAGLSVAYHAKPKVREQAMVAINDGGLDRLLDVLQG